MTNKKYGILYVGLTNNLLRRVIEHKQKKIKGFTQKYNITKLVWFEQTADIRVAIKKEKQIKKWLRIYKENVIAEKNPEWNDLFYEIGGNDEMLKADFKLYS
jgi:putative endonuclease